MAVSSSLKMFTSSDQFNVLIVSICLSMSLSLSLSLYLSLSLSLSYTNMHPGEHYRIMVAFCEGRVYMPFYWSSEGKHYAPRENDGFICSELSVHSKYTDTDQYMLDKIRTFKKKKVSRQSLPRRIFQC